MKRWTKLLILFFILLIIDFISKYYVQLNVAKMSWVHPFYPFGGIGVFKDFFGIIFSINFVENTGAAWGIFSKYPSILFYVRSVIVLGLILYLILFNLDKRKNIPFILIITGALGNILDYIFYRKVIDMFHFRFWGYSYPIFNFADVFITTGIIWLLITFFMQKYSRENV